LVLMVGILAGMLSSIFLATPLLVDFTMRKPAYRLQAERVYQRRGRTARSAGGAEPTAATADPGSTRRDESMVSAAGVPARVGKSVPAGRSRGRAAGKGGKPSGKASRSADRRQH